MAGQGRRACGFTYFLARKCQTRFQALHNYRNHVGQPKLRVSDSKTFFNFTKIETNEVIALFNVDFCVCNATPLPLFCKIYDSLIQI